MRNNLCKLPCEASSSVNTGHWYNGFITSVSKTENRSSILRWSALILLLLFIGCQAKKITHYEPMVPVNENDTIAVMRSVVILFDKNKEYCDCHGVGAVFLRDEVIYCPFHKDSPESFQESVPFKPQVIPSE